jgi:hypothetical protein
MTDPVQQQDIPATYEPPVGASKPVTRGSQYWMRVAVNHAPEVLANHIRGLRGLGSGAAVEWLSPRADDSLPYREYRDQDALTLLGLAPRTPVSEFWPSGGPVWDGLARIGDERLLVEAKGHVGELMSGASRATADSLARIQQALTATRAFLAPSNTLEWSVWNGPFYQYANRLAHLYFLREVNGLPVHMLWVYFLNATEVEGPATEGEWRAALQVIEGYLGLRQHKLQRYVHKIFVDVRELPQDIMVPRY